MSDTELTPPSAQPASIGGSALGRAIREIKAHPVPNILQDAPPDAALDDILSRAETGLMRFGEDWTGVFIRGDHAYALRDALTQSLAIIRAAGPHMPRLMRDQLSQLDELLRLLTASDVRQMALEPVQEMRAYPEACQRPS